MVIALTQRVPVGTKAPKRAAWVAPNITADGASVGIDSKHDLGRRTAEGSHHQKSAFAIEDLNISYPNTKIAGP